MDSGGGETRSGGSEPRSKSIVPWLKPFSLCRQVWKNLKDRLWGYDFFISYHWASGGTYAVNLAQRLRDRYFEVFLDRAEYAMGDDGNPRRQ